jgi:hypothetical protein
VPVATGGCAALCTQALSFTSALATCGSDTGATGTWHIAILDSSAKRTAFGSALPITVAWIGLRQMTGIWRWLDATNDVQAMTSPPWATGEPIPTNPYGLFDSTNQSDVFRSGSSSETLPFVCEYRP